MASQPSLTFRAKVVFEEYVSGIFRIAIASVPAVVTLNFPLALLIGLALARIGINNR